MTMTAQYRPYRDEDCVDGTETEHIGWPDHEPGVQIYEKTTEEIPFNVRRRRSLFMLIIVSILVGTICFFTGYFTHTSHSICINNTAALFKSNQDEDITIRAKLLDRIDSLRISRLAREFSSKPHVAGSDEDVRLAEKVQNFFIKNRLEHIQMKNYSVLLSLPNPSKPNFISIINNSGKQIYNSLNISTPNYEAFCPYSPPGIVTGDVMFVNYGRPIDYLQLQELFNTTENIFKGKILLAKQYHVPASEQYKYAMIMNASALLLYPDPLHYNPRNESPFPDSEWLPSDGIRSDSIFWNGAGDPQTFGLPSNGHAFKDLMEFSDQISIPTQPISYEQAAELFHNLDGMEVPADWRGGLNLTYRVGGMKNHVKVHLEVHNVLQNRTINNVMGTIRGQIEPDRYIIVGNQRDSLSYGAVDSATGTGTFLELVRVFSELVKEGWRPRRTIIFASWGAEDFNLLGSTEWVEEMNKILYMRTVAYVNINMLVTGNDTLSVEASPLLYHAIFNATKEVLLPKTELDQRPENFQTVYDKWLTGEPIMRNATTLVLNQNITSHLKQLGLKELENFHRSDLHQFRREESAEPGSILKTYLSSALAEIRPNVRPLDMFGSYAPFVSMAGIPSIDLSFVRRNYDTDPLENDEYERISFNHMPYPLLHTQYDRFETMERFIDPEFRYHQVAGQVMSELIRDLADSLFLPFNILDYAQLLKDFYLKSTQLHNTILPSFDQNDHNLMNQLDMKSLESAIHNFTNEAIKFHARQDKIDIKDPLAIRRINDQLMLIERQFLDHRGIPSNNHRRHLILSPAETASSFNALETEGLFPALLDELDQIIGNAFRKDIHHSLVRLQKHLPILINTIQSAAELLAEI